VPPSARRCSPSDWQPTLGGQRIADRPLGEPADDRGVRRRPLRRWLDAAFAQAQADGVDAVVIGTQADMWDLDGKSAADLHLTNYEPIISEIAQDTKAFGKPVLLFNGDSHVYRSDNPLVQGAPCVAEPSSGAAAVPCASDDYAQHPYYDVPNFHRVVVHGSTFPLEWLKLRIDPGTTNAPSDTAFGPFSWQRMTQPQ
jgi:hypothetical protein